MHPSAGAVAVGARPFLIAYNINLASEDVELAKRIARRVRESGGGLPRVQANGFWIEELRRAQVSMNLLDFSVTPIWLVWETVRELAAEDGVELAESELIGLAPLAAFLAVADHAGAPRRRPDRGSPGRGRARSSGCATSRRSRPSSCAWRPPARAEPGERLRPSGSSRAAAARNRRPACSIVGATEVVTMAGGVRSGRQPGRGRRGCVADAGPDGPGLAGRARWSPAGRAGSPRSVRGPRSRRRSRPRAIRSAGSPGSTPPAAW